MLHSSRKMCASAAASAATSPSSSAQLVAHAQTSAAAAAAASSAAGQTRGHRALSLPVPSLHLPQVARDAVRPVLKKRWSWRLKKPAKEVSDHEKMLAWRPPPSPTHPSSHHGSAHGQASPPLSNESSRSVSPVLILPHSAAIPTATYEAAPRRRHTSAMPGRQSPPSPVAGVPTRPLSPPASPVARSTTSASPTLAPSSPRPSLKRLDTPVVVSPRSPEVSEAVLRVGAWVGMTAVHQDAHREQGTRNAT